MKFAPLAGIETGFTPANAATLAMKFAPLAGIETESNRDRRKPYNDEIRTPSGD